MTACDARALSAPKADARRKDLALCRALLDLRILMASREGETSLAMKLRDFPARLRSKDLIGLVGYVSQRGFRAIAILPCDRRGARPGLFVSWS